MKTPTCISVTKEIKEFPKIFAKDVFTKVEALKFLNHRIALHDKLCSTSFVEKLKHDEKFNASKSVSCPKIPMRFSLQCKIDALNQAPFYEVAELKNYLAKK